MVVLLCGGNIDTTVFGRCLERGLAAEGRLVKFNVEVSDRPGGIHELCEILSSLGVSIKDIMHERAWLKDIYTVEVWLLLDMSKIYILNAIFFFYIDRLKWFVRPETGLIVQN